MVSLRVALVATFVATFFAASALATPTLTTPSSHWNVFDPYNQSANFDFCCDQQTGDSSADFVGDNTTHAGFFIVFDPVNNISSTDGWLYFRARFSSTSTSPQGLTSNLVVGLDVNGDFAVDLFIQVTGGAQDEIRIVYPSAICATCNTGPSTSELGTVPYSVAQDATNYMYGAVTTTLDDIMPANLDVDGLNGTDAYLTFRVSFAAIVSALASPPAGFPVHNITDTTPLSYFAATSQNINNLNQDVGGCAGTPGTWATCAFTDPRPPINTGEAPEPATIGLMAAGLGGLLWYRRRRQHSA